MKLLFKIIIISTFSLLNVLVLKGRDVIIYKDGKELKVLVQEVGFDLIRYKKYDYVTGPTYLEKKKLIFMI